MVDELSCKAHLPSPHKQWGERERALSYFPITQTNILMLEQQILLWADASSKAHLPSPNKQ